MDTGVHVSRAPGMGAQVYPLEGQAMPATTIRDKVHWGPVWAGLLTAFAVFMVVELFLYWIGALAAVAEPGGYVTGGASNSWISAIIAIAAFFIGGWVASSTATLRRVNSGMWNGLMVWSLGIVFILAFSALGFGMAFGAAGDAFSRFMVSGSGMLGSGLAAGGTSAHHLILMTRDTAGWGCLFLVLSAIAAALGGSMGNTAAMRRDPTGNAPSVP
jgi:hypothetical protein